MRSQVKGRRLLAHLLHIVSFVENHNCPLQVNAVCPATLGVQQVVVRHEDDISLLLQVPRKVVGAQSVLVPTSDQVLDVQDRGSQLLLQALLFYVVVETTGTTRYLLSAQMNLHVVTLLLLHLGVDTQLFPGAQHTYPRPIGGVPKLADDLSEL